MPKVILKFEKSHGPYNKGDVAGFEPEKARKLSGVAKPFDAQADAEMEAAIAAGALDEEVQKAAMALDQREADLKLREEALVKREAAAGGEAVSADPSNKAPAGDPPAQGKTAAKK